MSWVAKLAIAAPLLDVVVKLGPPWPSHASIGVVTAVAEAAMLMWAFQFWRRTAKFRRERRMRSAAAVAVCAGVIYLLLVSFFTFEVPSGKRHVRGLVLQPLIAALLQRGVATVPVPPPEGGAPERGVPVREHSASVRSVGDVLEQTGDQAERVWRPRSVFLMRLLFIVVWGSAFLGFIAFVGAFVLLQPQHEPPEE